MIGIRRRDNYPPTIPEFIEKVKSFKRRPWLPRL